MYIPHYNNIFVSFFIQTCGKVFMVLNWVDVGYLLTDKWVIST